MLFVLMFTQIIPNWIRTLSLISFSFFLAIKEIDENEYWVYAYAHSILFPLAQTL